MTLELMHYWRSSASYRVRIALELKNIETQFEHIDIRDDEHLLEAFAQANPQRFVPVLKHGGRVLTQSLAIIEYLEEMFEGARLLPGDPEGRVLARSLAHIVAMDIHPICNVSVLHQVKEVAGATPDAVSAWVRHFIAQGLGHLEARLAAMPSSPFSAGQEPTIADICLIPQLYNARRWHVDLSDFNNLLRIERNSTEIPAFAAAHPDRFRP